eukprot:3401100-Rhodomonas_salina.1
MMFQRCGFCAPFDFLEQDVKLDSTTTTSTTSSSNDTRVGIPTRVPYSAHDDTLATEGVGT